MDVKGLSCHRLTWQALSEHISPQDCWPVGEGAGHWYGGGESLSSRWPLDQGHINMSPFVTGDEDQTEWGNVIKKYFINSRGLSLMVEDTTPLSVSLNDQGHSGLCLKAHFDDFPYFYHRWVVTVLKKVIIVLKRVAGGCFRQKHSNIFLQTFFFFQFFFPLAMPNPLASIIYNHYFKMHKLHRAQ